MGNRKGCCAADMQAQKRRTDDVDMLLHDELAETENRIAVERQRYNDAVQDYNTYIGLFPNNIFARWAGFLRNNAYFTASEASREVPKVQFPGPGR
jgi:LemA protein